ncbi:MAG: AAA family ATPase [Candidatus Doudnabacteria bacterium]|nr:AAA family ATPase [Candidatus Doudnabacteria bacterium]
MAVKEKEKKEDELFKNKAAKQEWFKISRRVSLPVNSHTVDSHFIPKKINFEDNIKVVEQVAVAASWGMPVLLVGETGTGKTSLVRHLCSETKNGFVRVNHNGGTTVEDIVGRWVVRAVDGQQVTEWVDGILVEAMKKGYWFLADEINAASADINFVYHSLLDDDGRVLLVEKGNEVVIPNSNFRFFGAMNPPTEYAGTKELNKALMSRFMVVNVDFPAPKIEEKILVDRTGIPSDVAEKMVTIAGAIRIMHGKGEVRFVLSTRELLMWATMFKVYKRFMLSAEMSVLNKVGTDDFEVIRDMMNLQFSTIDKNLKE